MPARTPRRSCTFLAVVLVALICGQHVSAAADKLSQAAAAGANSRDLLQAGSKTAPSTSKPKPTSTPKPKTSGVALVLPASKPAPKPALKPQGAAARSSGQASQQGAARASIIPLIIKGAIFLGAKIAALAKSGAVAAAVGGAVCAGVTAAIDGNAPPTVVCNGACTFDSRAQEISRAAPASVNGCTSEECLCSAMGPGVHPNIFDSSCGTFFHCPGPKRPCGPGTLFNPEFNVCDWPYNVKCVGIVVG